MDPTTAIAFAIRALEAMPSLINMTVEAVKYLESTVTQLKIMQAEGRDPSESEWQTLNKTIDDLRASRPAV